MQYIPDTALHQRLIRWSRYLSAVVIMISSLALAGWLFNIDELIHPIPGLAAMNPLAAVFFIFCAVSFLLLTSPVQSDSKKWIALALTAFVLVVAFIKLVAFVAGFEWPVDQVLFSDKLQNYTTGNIPDTIAFHTILCFLLAAIAIAGLYADRRKKNPVSSYFGLALAFAGWLSILGYLYHVPAFYGFLSYRPIALPAAVCFLFIALAILFAQPGRGIIRDFTSITGGSVTAQLLAPAAVLVPTIIGLLYLLGRWSGIYTTEYGIVLYTSAIIVIFLLVAWYIAYVLNRRDIYGKQTEAALQDSEEELAAIFRSAPDAVILIDEHSRIVKWNPEAEKLFGWTISEATGKPLTETIIPSEYREAHKKGMQRLMRTGQSDIAGKTVELNALRKDNTYFDIALRVAPVVIKGSYMFVGFVRDISEQKKRDQQLREFNEQLSRLVDEKTKELTDIFEQLTDGFIALDNNFRCTYVNKKAGEMARREPASLIGKNLWEEFPAAVGSDTYKALHKALADQQYIINAGHYEPLDLWHESHIYPSAKGVSVFIRDITGRKRTEQKISEARKLADKLIDSLPGIFYFCDTSGRFIRWNKQFERVTGYTGTEIAVRRLSDFFSDDEQAYIKQCIAVVFEKGQSDAETGFVTKSGERIPHYCKAVLIHYEGQPCLLGYGMDIRERKKHEEALRSSEKKYKLLFENNPLPMWMLSLTDYRVLDVNIAALSQYGYTREEFFALQMEDIRPEEDREVFRKVTNTEFRSVHHAGIWRHLRKNGTIIYVDIITHDTYYDDMPARFVLANDVTEKYIAEEKLKESYESIRSLTEHLQKIREEERTHIAREIHDELGQQLTVLKLDIAWLNKKIGNEDEKLKDKIKDLLSVTDTTVKTIRRIASELRPSLLDDVGLIPAMEWHIEEFKKRSGIVTEFRLAASDAALSDEIRIGLFRILQESLTNVARHAGAKNVNINFVQHDKEVILTISDDGIGFDRATTSKKTLGILGMEERALMLGGQFSITGNPGNGTTISVTVPVETSDH